MGESCPGVIQLYFNIIVTDSVKGHRKPALIYSGKIVNSPRHGFEGSSPLFGNLSEKSMPILPIFRIVRNREGLSLFLKISPSPGDARGDTRCLEDDIDLELRDKMKEESKT